LSIKLLKQIACQFNLIHILFDIIIVINCVYKTGKLIRRAVQMTTNMIYNTYIHVYICMYIYSIYYWVVRKVRADFEGKLKRRRFKF